MISLANRAKDRLKVLMVDDEDTVRSLYVYYVKRYDVIPLEASDGQQAWELFKEHRPEIVITDIRMPNIDGLGLLKLIAEEDSETEVILATGFADMDVVIEALRCGAANLIEKPFSRGVFQSQFERSLKRVSNRFEKKLLLLELEKERKERDLSARMATVGRLMAGLAHEIHNPLTFLKGNAELVNQLFIKHCEHSGDQSYSGKITELLGDIEFGAKRIESLLVSLGRFGNISDEPKKLISLASLLENCERLTRAKRPPNVKLETVKVDPTLHISVHRVEFESCLINLIINAFEASAQSGGTVTVVATPQAEENMLEILVNDEGIGIPEEVVDTIFTPFYSDKEGGTGLGLSIAYESAKKNDATLTITPRPQGGTSAHINIKYQIVDG